MLGFGEEDFTLGWLDLGRQLWEEGTELTYTEGLKQTGRAKIFFSEEYKMWSKRSKISYFHDHFKTPSLEVLELKFPKCRSHRPPKAKLSYITLFVQFWIAVEGGRQRTFMSC